MRLVTAVAAFFKILFDADFAQQVNDLRQQDHPRRIEGGPESSSPDSAAHDARAALEAELAEARGAAEAQIRAAVQRAEADARAETSQTVMRTTATVLGILQREGRLVDFLQEDIAAFDDAQIGAAVRPVHEGCRNTLKRYVTLKAVRTEAEGDSVTVDEGFDPSAIRLTGTVKGDPPFRGVLRHHGWQIERLELPDRPTGQAAEVVAPAEVEVP